MAVLEYPLPDGRAISHRVGSDQNLMKIAQHMATCFAAGRGVWIPSRTDDDPGDPGAEVLTFVPPTASVALIFDGASVPSELDDLRSWFDDIVDPD